MKTRMKKWARYRAKIQCRPQKAFKARPTFETDASEEDMAIVSETGLSTKAISLSTFGLKDRKSTPYNVYWKRKSIWLFVKVSLFVIFVVGFVCLYIYWVR
jgi:hypothetical protein